VIIRWLSLATRDLDALFAFVAKDSPALAEKEVDRVIESVLPLRAQPAMGRPGRVPETRELVIQPYIVAYRVKGGIVQILRVLHSAREWPKNI